MPQIVYESFSSPQRVSLDQVVAYEIYARTMMFMGNKSKAAKSLKITRKTLYKYLNLYSQYSKNASIFKRIS